MTIIMNRKLSASLILLFVGTCQSVVPICDKLCVCKGNQQKFVDCARVLLNIIPRVDSWPENAVDLNLSGNNITEIDVEMTHLHLETLNLHHNRIAIINASVFGGLTHLKSLDLSNNNIEKLELQTFYGIAGLTHLDLSDNNIQTLPEQIFSSLPIMEDLNLAKNKLTYISREHLNKMFNLKVLDLSENELYSLPANLFHDFIKLEYLDLSGNQFHEVPTEGIRSAKNLKQLRLSENPIEELNKKSFYGMNKLRRLELNHDQKLEKVDANSFSPLIFLKTLEIKHNKNLKYIHPDAFKGLFQNKTPMLQEVDLEFNKLTTLTSLPCKSMSELNLQKNPWKCDCTILWVRNCYMIEIYAADLKCLSPYKLRGRLLREVPEEEFVCERLSPTYISQERHHNRVMRSLFLAMGAGLLLVLSGVIILVVKWRSLRGWWRNRRKGPGAVYYVRAQANPAQDN